MEEKIIHAESIFHNLMEEIEDRYHEMIEENSSYWSISSDFVDILLYSNYFEHKYDTKKVIDLGVLYFKQYNLEKDPWYIKGDLSFITIFLWNRYIYFRLLGYDYKEYETQYFSKIITSYHHLKPKKSDSANWENFIFVSWFTNNSIPDLIAINNVLKRQLLDIYIQLEITHSNDLTLLENYKIQFNKNKKNIMFNIEHGIPQIFYYYFKNNRTPSIKEICEVQFEGLM